MKPRVVFLFYHGYGHINPCLPLAKALTRKNYDVHFAGVEYFAQYVNQQDFPYHTLNSVPFGLGFETWMNTISKKKNIYLSTLIDRITNTLFNLRHTTLLGMLNELRPDVILIDAAQSTDFIVLYPFLKRRRIKVAIVHAMFPTHVIPGRPPANCDAFPEDKERVKKATSKMKWQQGKKNLKQKLIFLFSDDRYIIKRNIRKNHIPKRYYSTTPSLFNFTVSGITEFILAPREFDFPDFEVSTLQHYIGFTKNENRNEPLNSVYSSAREVVNRQKVLKNSKLIYCSFGTVESDRRADILVFMEKLIRITQRKSYLLIISMKSYPSDVSHLNDQGVYIFDKVPQVDLLRNTDLFITHGGLSSIKESIDAGVPMLLYPVHGEFDCKGNAARVVYHGMGLRGDIQNDTEDEIGNKINALLTNEKFREEVSVMRIKNAEYTTENFLSLFQKLSAIN